MLRVLGGALTAITLSSAAPAGPPALRAIDGESRPSFVLPDPSGRLVDLSSLRGRVVFVHFFATWCEPCREELPALQRLALSSKDEASVIAVSVGEPELRVQRFVQSTEVSFPILLDGERSIARSWRVVSLPTTFVLDRDLTPILVTEQDIAWDNLDLTQLFEQLAARDIRRDTPTSAARNPNNIEREE